MILNASQQQVLSQIHEFLQGPSQCMVLTGQAGSGKTTLIRHLLEDLRSDNHQAQLLATTGRAARILGRRCSHPASTIHHAIYELGDVHIDTVRGSASVEHTLKRAGAASDLVIVDEASQLGSRGLAAAASIGHSFGSGNLLADLMEWCGLHKPLSGRPAVKLLLLGDNAQLAPVGQDNPVALNAAYLSHTFNLNVSTAALEGNCRQQNAGSVVHHALQLRAPSPRLPLDVDWLPSRPDWQHLSSDVEAAQYRKCFHRGDESMIITSSNYRALDLNQKVRALLHNEFKASLSCGDLLMVAQNNYASCLMNGDMMRVERAGPSHEVTQWVKIGKISEPVTLRFRGVRLAYNRLSDMRRYEMECLILENGLDSPYTAISDLERQALLVHFLERCRKEKLSRDEVNQRFLSDPYLNAVVVKYGYAMTCHKAQGGEWDTVIVDVPTFRDMDAAQVQRWLYTAITRARHEVRLLNAGRLDLLVGRTAKAGGF